MRPGWRVVQLLLPASPVGMRPERAASTPLRKRLSLVPTLSFRPEPILQDTRLASIGQPCTRRTWMLFFCNALHGVFFG